MVAAAILSLATMAIFPGVVFHSETPSEGDLTRYHRPVKSMLTRLWAENDGPTPEWTPYLSSGQPFRANPHFGAAHPSALLFRLLPFNAAFLIWVLLPLPAGAAGMYLLLRQLGRSRDTAVLMAAAWGLGGFALSTVAMPPMAWTAMLAPGAIALVVRSVVLPSAGSVVLAAAGLALCVAGGSPISIVATGVLVVAAIVDRKITETSRTAPGISGRTQMLQLAAVAFLSAALAAPVLIPGAALSERSIRAEEMALEKSNEWSLPTVRLIEPWLPTVAGSTQNVRWAWSDTTYQTQAGDPLVASVYPGVFITVLALAAVVARRRTSLPWIVVAVFGAIASLGTATPLWGAILSRLPLVGGVRYPEKWVILPAIAAIVLAASALDGIRTGDRRSRRLVSFMLVATTLTGLLLALLVGLHTPAGGVLVDLENTASSHLFVKSVVLFAAMTLVVFLAWTLALRLGWRWGVVVMGAALAADLGLSGHSIVETQPAEDLDRLPRTLAPLVTPGGAQRLFDLASWQPDCRPQHPALQPRPIQWGIPLVLDHTYDLTQLQATAHAVDAVAGLGASRPDLLPVVLARRSVDAVLTCPPDKTALRIPALVPVQSPTPQVSCVDRVATIGDDSAWAPLVRTLGPEDVQRTAIVINLSAKPAVAAAPCRVEALEITPDRWRFRVEGIGPEQSFVVLTQTWDRYWRARVDGQPADLERCEINLSGLWISPGRHVVELDYSDPTVLAGNTMFLIGLVLCAGVVIAGRRRNLGRPG